MSIFSKNSKYRKYIDTRTVGVEAVGVLISRLGWGDRYLTGLNAMFKVYNKLKRKYKKHIGKKEFPSYKSDNEDRIWVCWLQGMDKAPELVKECYNSLKYHADKEIVLIDGGNFSDYCTLPDYIVEKWKKGIIPNAQFSDIIRLQLLIENGGIWIDSTVYLTGALPDYIENSELFLYQTGWFNLELINIGNWLIKAKADNQLLKETQNLLFEYWKSHNYLCQYFLFQIFFRMVSDFYKEEFSKIPYINQVDQHLLSYELHKSFDKSRLEVIKSISTVHKLTYKLDGRIFEENSYFDNLKTIYEE